jgi:chromosome segregation ATPase
MQSLLSFPVFFGLLSTVVFFAGLCFWVWRDNQGFQGVLKEASQAYDLLGKKYEQSKRQWEAAEKKITSAQEMEMVLRASLDEASERNFAMEAEVNRITADFDRKLRDIEAQRNQLLRQYENLSQELQTKSEADPALTQEIRSLKTENQSLKHALTKAVNPRDFDTLKRKVGHIETLYSSVRGQKTMLDERMKNWETALEKMSLWILNEGRISGEKRFDASAGIGPLVGEALSRIGAQLVKDDNFETELSS